MEQERDHQQERLHELCRWMDAETRHLSGGFNRLPAFQQIVGMGEAALPSLVADRQALNWWRLEAVGTIAHLLNNPIEYPDECRGRLNEVRNITLQWAVLNGYKAEAADRED